MRFRIRDGLYTTAVVAALIAFARIAFPAFLLLFLFANACLLFCPIAILLTTVALADQRGQMLDLNTNPLYSVLKKTWLLAVLCSGATWFILFTIPFRG